MKMSKRVTLTDAEIKLIVGKLEGEMVASPTDIVQYQNHNLKVLIEKLNAEPVTKYKGLLKVNH
jgi:hypothetical protein